MSFFKPKNIDDLSYQDKIKFVLVWRLSAIFVFALIILSTAFFILEDSNSFYTYLVGLGIITTGYIFLTRTRKFLIIYKYYVVCGTIIVHTDVALINDSPHYANFLWTIIIIMLAFLGINKKWGIGVLFVNIAGTLVYVVFGMNRHYQALFEVGYSARLAVGIELSFCFLLIGYLLHNFEKLHVHAKTQLIEKNKELELQNEIVKKRDHEKTILVKEIHHRVKNNLQIIISLLRLQMSDLKNAESKAHFSEAINRVMVMSSIHQKLYQEKEITDFNLTTYIEELAHELKQFYKEEFPIDFNIESNYSQIDLKTVVPVGLILNELLSNSLKYAFNDLDSGKIEIKINDKGDHFILEYRDNGKWKSPDANNTGFGIELIEVLTEQLNGTKSMRSDENGTHYTFDLMKIKENSNEE